MNALGAIKDQPSLIVLIVWHFRRFYEKEKRSLFETLSTLHEMIASSDHPPYPGGTATLTADELRKLLDVVEAAKIHLEQQKNGTYDIALHIALDEVYKK